MHHTGSQTATETHAHTHTETQIWELVNFLQTVWTGTTQYANRSEEIKCDRFNVGKCPIKSSSSLMQRLAYSCVAFSIVLLRQLTWSVILICTFRHPTTNPSDKMNLICGLNGSAKYSTTEFSPASSKLHFFSCIYSMIDLCMFVFFIYKINTGKGFKKLERRPKRLY